jgi:diguanylate cyclase (GGDEF)-like protein
LVEDSSFQAKMLEGMLRTGGLQAEVQHATSIAEARAALYGFAGVSCILLDLMLPDTSGLDGVIDIRDAAPDAPLVVVTADDDEARAVKAMQLGAQDYLIEGRIDADLLGRSIHYAIERKRGELQLAHQALHDPLTRLPNRVLFADRLELALAQSMRTASIVSVLFCDLDGFRGVNDARGHATGDRVLRAVAGRLLSSVRPGDTVARHGGDEFTILSSELETDEEAVAIVTRLGAALSEPLPFSDRQTSIATSVGVALCSDPAHRPPDVIDAAEEAMYRAKSNGVPHELVML